MKIPYHKPTASRQQVEALGMLGGCIVAVLAAICTPLTIRYLRIDGFSLTMMGITLACAAAAIAFLAFITGYSHALEQLQVTGRLRRTRQALMVFVLAFIHAALVFLFIVALSNIVEKYLTNLTFDDTTFTVIAIAVVAIVFYLFFVLAASMNSYKLVGSLVAFLLSGILTSIITADNGSWWSIHFSALGAGQTASSYTFNLTLTLGGVIVVGLADYIISDLQLTSDVKKEKYSSVRTNILRILFMAIGLCMIGVAVFPYDKFLMIHNMCGYGMAVIFGVLVITLPFLLPFFPRIFYAISYVFIGMDIFSYYSWIGLGRISFTTFELVGSALFFVWIMLFIRQINAVCLDEAMQRPSISRKTPPEVSMKCPSVERSNAKLECK